MTPNRSPRPPAPRSTACSQSGDLFRYTSDNAPVALLEAEFAAMLGSRYALAVSSCSAALFLSLEALDLPRGAKVLDPGLHLRRGPVGGGACGLHAGAGRGRRDYRIDMADFEAKLRAPRRC